MGGYANQNRLVFIQCRSTHLKRNNNRRLVSSATCTIYISWHLCSTSIQHHRATSSGSQRCWIPWLWIQWLFWVYLVSYFLGIFAFVLGDLNYSFEGSYILLWDSQLLCDVTNGVGIGVCTACAPIGWRQSPHTVRLILETHVRHKTGDIMLLK